MTSTLSDLDELANAVSEDPLNELLRLDYAEQLEYAGRTAAAIKQRNMLTSWTAATVKKWADAIDPADDTMFGGVPPYAKQLVELTLDQAGQPSPSGPYLSGTYDRTSKLNKLLLNRKLLGHSTRIDYWTHYRLGRIVFARLDWTAWLLHWRQLLREEHPEMQVEVVIRPYRLPIGMDRKGRAWLIDLPVATPRPGKPDHIHFTPPMTVFENMFRRIDSSGNLIQKNGKHTSRDELLFKLLRLQWPSVASWNVL